MSIQLGFRDHEGFHRAAAAMTSGGAIAGLTAGLLGAGVPGALFAGSAGALLGVAWADRAAGIKRMAARVAAIGIAITAFFALRAMGGTYAGVIALSAVVGVALNLGTGWRRAIAALTFGGAIAYLGAFAAGQVMVARETAPLPHAIEVMIAGLAMSMVSIAALLPRHLLITRDAIAVAQAALPRNLDADVRSLVDRGVVVWRHTAPRLDGENRSLLSDAVLRLHDLAIRWAKVGSPSESIEVLEKRKAELDTRIDASKDDIAREQYKEARAAIDDQLRYITTIEQSRERVVARLHACVNTLEKFRLAAANLESVGLLAEVSADINAASEAIAMVPSVE